MEKSLKGHGHWVNTLALSTEAALRTGAFDHTGSAPAEPEEAKAKALQRFDPLSHCDVRHMLLLHTSMTWKLQKEVCFEIFPNSDHFTRQMGCLRCKQHHCRATSSPC